MKNRSATCLMLSLLCVTSGGLEAANISVLKCTQDHPEFVSELFYKIEGESISRYLRTSNRWVVLCEKNGSKYGFSSRGRCEVEPHRIRMVDFDKESVSEETIIDRMNGSFSIRQRHSGGYYRGVGACQKTEDPTQQKPLF